MNLSWFVIPATDIAQRSDSINPIWWISPVVAIVGWLVFRHFQNERETRNEVRTHIAELKVLIEVTQAQCYRYYSKAGGDPTNADIGQDIRCKLKQAGFRAASLSQVLPGCNVVSQFIKFRQAASLKLDDMSRMPFETGDKLFEEVSNSGGQIIRGLDSAFHNRFRA